MIPVFVALISSGSLLYSMLPSFFASVVQKQSKLLENRDSVSIIPFLPSSYGSGRPRVPEDVKTGAHVHLI